MGKINVLDKHVAELIAAGEVVERPSSVIKELVENSIDAGANSITVEIQKGGISYMRVSDNGSGILRDDIKVAFVRHATSKVKDEEDLLKIGTLGFRGEALASISSVSHLELITKSKNEDIGTRYVISAGVEESFDDAGCPDGTTFIIRDIFYNIPARLKFLKSDVAEGNAISNVIDKEALSHPEIAFTYIKDSKTILKTSGDGKLLSAIYSVYGKDFADSLIPVDYTLGAVSVKGYISRPDKAKPNRNMQNFFLNNRYVISKTLMAAISEATKGSVMIGKFASCVLFVDVALDAVDVNVHPTKLEVRFVNEKPIFDAVYHAVKSALMKGDTPKEATINKVVSPFEMAKKVFREENNISKQQKSNNTFTNTGNFVKSSFEDKNPFDIYSKQAVKNQKSIDKKIEEYKAESNITKLSDEKIINIKNDIEEEKPEDNNQINTLIDIDEKEYKFIGEAFDAYAIIEYDNELILIDKHAAHERVIYEKLKKEQGNGFSQILLSPLSVTLNKVDYNSVITNLDLFKDACFDVEDFGDGTVLVRSAPQYLENSDIESSIEEMAGYITEHKSLIKTEQMDWIYHNISCRAAIKAGNKSSSLELVSLAKEILTDDSLKHCPHGRPICIKITKREIEKNFGRV